MNLNKTLTNNNNINNNNPLNRTLVNSNIENNVSIPVSGPAVENIKMEIKMKNNNNNKLKKDNNNFKLLQEFARKLEESQKQNKQNKKIETQEPLTFVEEEYKSPLGFTMPNYKPGKRKMNNRNNEKIYLPQQQQQSQYSTPIKQKRKTNQYNNSPKVTWKLNTPIPCTAENLKKKKNEEKSEEINEIINLSNLINEEIKLTLSLKNEIQKNYNRFNHVEDEMIDQIFDLDNHDLLIFKDSIGRKIQRYENYLVFCVSKTTNKNKLNYQTIYKCFEKLNKVLDFFKLLNSELNKIYSYQQQQQQNQLQSKLRWNKKYGGQLNNNNHNNNTSTNNPIIQQDPFMTPPSKTTMIPETVPTQIASEPRRNRNGQLIPYYRNPYAHLRNVTRALYNFNSNNENETEIAENETEIANNQIPIQQQQLTLKRTRNNRNRQNNNNLNPNNLNNNNNEMTNNTNTNTNNNDLILNEFNREPNLKRRYPNRERKAPNRYTPSK